MLSTRPPYRRALERVRQGLPGRLPSTARREEDQMEPKRKRFLGTLIGVLLLVPMTLPAAAPALAADVPDQVLAWNQHAYEDFLLVQPAPVALFHVAMVHGAIYDAVNAIDGGFQPYLGAPPALGSYSTDAAAAAAGYRVMLALLPGRA